VSRIAFREDRTAALPLEVAATERPVGEQTTRGIGAFLDSRDDASLDTTFRNVLLVDDDACIRRIASRVLETSGYTVRQAADGQAAMEALRYSPPDFIVTDWQMPRMDGLELCRAVRSEHLSRYVYVIVVTGKNETKDMVQAIAAGADNFFSKPIIPGELLARLMSGARILELEHRLIELARSDSLTGLLNRRTFFGLFEQQWSAASRSGSPLSCIMIDVDFFKKINDSLGHLAGDLVLKEISRHLKKSCRTSDFVCRYGGEEFCVLLPGTCASDALRWAERCRQTIAALPISAKEGQVQVTISLGVAARIGNVQTPEQLLDQADQALLLAKQLGRNRVHQFAG
jgi:two-component system chemotaxis response regulator CheY